MTQKPRSNAASRSLGLLALWAVLGPLALLGARTRAADSGLEPIARLVRDGEHQRALEQLEQLPDQVLTSVSALYLRARLYEALGSTTSALQTIEGLQARPTLPPWLASELGVRRERLLLAVGRCDELRAALQARIEQGLERASKLSPDELRCVLDGDARAELTERFARELRAMGELDGRSAQRRRARLVLELAKSYEKLNQPREAAALLRAVLVELPTESEDAREALEALGKRAARLSLAEQLRRAERLLEAARASEALESLQKLKPPKSPKLRARYLHLKGMALFRLRTRYTEAAKTLAQAARLRSPTQIDDAFHAARALARADQDRRAIPALRAVARRYPKSHRAGEALHLAAWLELRLGNEAGARALERFAEGPYAPSHPKLAGDSQYLLGAKALERGAPANARKHFERYADAGSDPLVRAGGHYHAGLAALAQGDAEAARASFEAAQRVEPLHYYALLADRRLRALAPELTPALASGAGQLARVGASPPPLALPDEVAFLFGLGLVDDSVAALRRSEDAVRERAPDGRELEALVRAYHALGEHTRPHRLVQAEARELLREPPGPHNRWAYEAVYARPFRAEVSAACAREGVDEDLAYAVMLKESAFAPEVVSSADALGLMQLLPATARKVAAGTDLPSDREALLSPETNIALGVRLLGQLLRRYDGQAMLAIAAYNAGEHRVDRWLAREAHARNGAAIPFEELVEAIPITQTRNYVRRVTSFWARYRYLRSGEPLVLPETVTGKK